MDLILLTFFNQILAHPLLDVLMIGLTYGGFVALPGLGLGLLLTKQQQEGRAALLTLSAALVFTFVFKYLALRPHPAAVRLVLPPSPFPAYPSGYAAATLALAVFLTLCYPRGAWMWAMWSIAALLAVSGVYLGSHYPSDIAGGVVIGVAVGTAGYGLLLAPSTGPSRWRWLLWPPAAVVVIVTQMAYLDILPQRLLAWPLSDKVLHFLLFGTVAFWLNLWFNGRVVRWLDWSLPLAVFIPFTLAYAEEGMQYFSPLRSSNLDDLLSDLMGMLFFWWLSRKILIHWKNKTIGIQT